MRKPMGKRLRFEIFKRDRFTCQYCGAQPPDVVLVVDHITPVAGGGSSEPENLITACEGCNAGKSDKPLTERIVRPDADLLYLETQQEIAELRRYQAAKADRDAVMAEVVGALQDTFTEITRFSWAPGDAILRNLLEEYSPEIVEAALINIAGKLAGGYLKTYNNKWVAYLYTVARNMAAERQQ